MPDINLAWDGAAWRCNQCHFHYAPVHTQYVDIHTSPFHTCPIPLTPEEIAEQKTEQERQQAEAIEIGKSLGWTIEDATKWIDALWKWNQAGRPKRTDEEGNYIVSICEACDKYKADEKRCRLCRCGVSTGNMAIFNKAKMGSEHCPDKIKKW